MAPKFPTPGKTGARRFQPLEIFFTIKENGPTIPQRGGFVGPFKAKLLGFGVALLEALHTTFGVEQFGRAGVERMAARTGVHAHFPAGGARFNDVATGATNCRRRIFWMNVSFHE